MIDIDIAGSRLSAAQRARNLQVTGASETMMMWLMLIGGLVLLLVGGELLVRGAVRVASRLGMSPLVIGITLVGFGTSAPELVTSVQAALNNAPGIAFGNIVGSNIANLLLILGASSLVTLSSYNLPRCAGTQRL